MNSAEKQYTTDYSDFINSIIPCDLVLEIEYESDAVFERTYFSIKHNGQIAKKFNLQKETSNLTLNLPYTKGPQVVEMSMFNKGIRDTQVENGQIVKDTYIKLLNLKINNYTLLEDYNYLNNYAEYKKHKSNAQISPMFGFYEDATLKLTFANPFDLWYNAISTKNKEVSASLQYRKANNIDSLVQNLEKSLQKLI